jgi:competence protein ComEA
VVGSSVRCMRGWLGDDSDDVDVRERFERVTGLPPAPDDEVSPAAGGAWADPPSAGAHVRAGVLAAFDPGRRGVRALGIVAAVVVCIAAFFAWRARPHEAPVPVVQASAVASGGPVAGGPPSSTLVVAVGGRVHRPGLVRLPAGARVADAIEAAGGALPDTDLSYVNLARKVVDGELIVVGVTPPPAVPGGPGAAGGPAVPGGAVSGGVVNVNGATLAELQTLPGIGAVLAQRILDYRTSHGQFRSVNELRQVDGIGDAKFAQLKDRVTV